MAPKPDKQFTEFQQSCKFRTYQDNKCINEANKTFRKVGSCFQKACPLYKTTHDGQSAG